ncbi:alpha-(1,3)-fucosyltransferase c-like [Plakobranchus ocellatus]|uniref:Fucosyltransferase n=1 Tax=Plakobranchus ocellatus TaxID=259542 RepID=A0AAV4C567_9GAST|nr:alpha-(1,3)-fucosyltransferase c-like [Plakobranchus ocellatus]
MFERKENWMLFLGVQKIIDSGLVAKTGFKPESLTPDRLGKVNIINSRSGKFDDEGINNSDKDIGSDDIGDDRADDLKGDFNSDDNMIGNDGGNDGRSDGGSDEVGDDRADDLKDDFNNDDNVTGNDGGNDGRSDDGLDEVGDDRADDLKDDFNNDDNMKDNDDNGYDNEVNETHTDDEDLNYMKEESIEDENERLKTSPYIFHEEEKEIIPQPPKMQGTKVISQWKIDSMYHKSFSRCSYNQCRWDSNNSLADAVLFKASSVRSWKIEPFPRKPGQRWVFYTIDPAIKNYGLDRKDVAGQFNATSTYQLRSDYSRIFGKLRRVPTPKRNFDKIFDGKQKQVAWFVSHCSTWSKREVYIKRMREIIPVDVFGACGNLTCGESPRRKAEDGEVCLPLLSKHYK